MFCFCRTPHAVLVFWGVLFFRVAWPILEKRSCFSFKAQPKTLPIFSGNWKARFWCSFAFLSLFYSSFLKGLYCEEKRVFVVLNYLSLSFCSSLAMCVYIYIYMCAGELVLVHFLALRELGTVPPRELGTVPRLGGQFRTTNIVFVEIFCVNFWSQLVSFGFQFFFN